RDAGRGRSDKAEARIADEARSHRVGAALAGADAHRLLDRDHEDLAVADLVGLGGLLDRLDGARGEGLLDDDLDFDLGQEVDQVFGAAIDFGVALLPAEAPDLADGHAGDADVAQRAFDLIELERLDDRLDFLHRLTIATSPGRLAPGSGPAGTVPMAGGRGAPRRPPRLRTSNALGYG